MNTPVIPALGKRRQEDRKFKVNPGYTTEFKTSLVYRILCLKAETEAGQGQNSAVKYLASIRARVQTLEPMRRCVFIILALGMRQGTGGSLRLAATSA